MVEHWESPVESFINCYKTERLTLKGVLFLIETLPEETTNGRLIMIPELHSKVNIKLKNEYAKAVDFLFSLRKSSTDFANTGNILRCWHNWRRFDTFSSNGEICRLFLEDCLTIIKHPNMRGHGLDDEIYEVAINCMIDVLQECAYLSSRDTAGGINSYEDYDDVQYSKRRYADLQHIQKACFEACIGDLLQHLSASFASSDVFLYSNLSRVYANLLDSLHFSLSDSNDAQLLKLIHAIIHFIELPYCLIYAQSGIENVINPFDPSYNRAAAREAVFDRTSSSEFDEESASIAQKAVFVLCDILSRHNTAVESIKSICNEILDIFLLISITPPIQPLVEYELYIRDSLEIFHELARIIPGGTMYEHIHAHTIGHAKFQSSPIFLESALRILGPIIEKIDIKRNIHLLDSIHTIVNILEGHCSLPCIRFLGDIRRVFLLDGTEILLERVLRVLHRSLQSSSEDDRYEAVQSISSLCYYIKLEKLQNRETVLHMLVGCMEIMRDNESLLSILLEGIALASCDLATDDIQHVIAKVSMPWIEAIEGNTLSTPQVRILVDRMTSLVRNLSNRPGIAIISGRILPLLLELLKRHHEDADSVECICRCIKHCARCMNMQFAGHIPLLVATISQVAGQKMFGTYLYLVEWLHGIFYTTPKGSKVFNGHTVTPENLESISTLYHLLTRSTLEILKLSQMADVEDMIEDFYGLQAQFILHTKFAYEETELADQIVSISATCMAIRKPQCVFSFWESLLKRGKEVKTLENIALKYLGAAAASAFRILASGCPKSTEHYIEDFTISIVDRFGRDCLPFLEQALDQLPPAIISDSKKKNSLLESLLGSRTKSTVHHIHKLSSQLAMRNRF
ncbi:hypothetical protein BEWA_023760 [Theileria equi strain WA]|uniref:Exportin-1/Importin-beta-like domain-containing protein n=1 Tax=Theileria equi strain WA TaxID=1537102 RepID=L0AV88_THEEQ|nr:hypothetical protein BEWA_023760 [Theileria equi strain WA]AFZ79527.1 hypothetical protein BEWA_023760 [Theileria equi strain WA]|eukprot:XP_004829193.1 hypothetical protein BEWA_023760 [Theileria equi strain WA]